MKFQPGQSGNPNGRPTGAANKSTLDIIEAFDTGVNLEWAVKKLAELIDEGNLSAIKLYFNYRFGRPREMVYIENTFTEKIRPSWMMEGGEIAKSHE